MNNTDAVDYSGNLLYGSGTQNNNSFCVANQDSDSDGDVIITVSVAEQNGLADSVNTTVYIPACIPVTDSGFVEVLAETSPVIELFKLSNTSYV